MYIVKPRFVQLNFFIWVINYLASSKFSIVSQQTIIISPFLDRLKPQYMAEVTGLFIAIMYSTSIVSLAAMYAVIYSAAHGNSRRRRKVNRGVTTSRKVSAAQSRCSTKVRGDVPLPPAPAGTGGMKKYGRTQLRKWSR